MRRVFVDHGEAYGNLGDEAMLQSALRRLSAISARFDSWCRGKAGARCRRWPAMRSKRSRRRSHRLCACAIRRSGRYGSDLILRLAKRKGLAREVLVADLLARSGRLSAVDTDFREFRAALGGCDAFYGVGAADYNDFNHSGAPYKAWLYRVARRAVPLVAVAAQGFGPVKNPELADVMREGFSALDILTFRDHAFSDAFTRGLGGLRCETRVVGDEAFSLPAAPVERRDHALAGAGRYLGGRRDRG